MTSKQKLMHLTAQMKGRLEIVFIFILALFLVLAVRLGYWNLVKGKEFATKVLENQESSSTMIPYERGKIYDRNGNILATNEKKYTLILEPKNILANESSFNHTIDILNKYLRLNKKTLSKYIRKHENSYYQVFKKDLTYPEVEELLDFLSLQSKNSNDAESEEEAEQIRSAQKVKGVRFEENYQRIYPYNNVACRILGYTLAGNVGTWGLEQYYNDKLNGINGRTYSYLNQELITEKTVKQPENGDSLISTIDVNVQKIVEEQIAAYDKKIGSKNTSVLVMNPQNGEVYAMASSNSFDLNDPMNEKELEQIYTPAEIAEMKAYTIQLQEQQNDEESTTEKITSNGKKQITIYDAFSKLQRNPIISDANEPGSTYKAVTVAAGLESGVLTGDEYYYCTGSLKVADRSIGCSHVHADLNLQGAISKSCNVAMMNIAFKEGAETFYFYQNMFGFGQKTGIDLPGEANTSRLVYNATNYQNDVTLATNAFGQNFNSSMVQMAAAYGALINGGKYYQPHVVKQVISDDGSVVENVATDATREVISEDTSEQIKKYLRATVTEGTGKIAAIPGYNVGGKTGTAEKMPRNKHDYYVSFMGFDSVENPELLIYVTIDEPRISNQESGTSLATELERRCMTKIVEQLNIKPDDEEAYEAAKENGTYDLKVMYEGY